MILFTFCFSIITFFSVELLGINAINLNLLIEYKFHVLKLSVSQTQMATKVSYASQFVLSNNNLDFRFVVFVKAQILLCSPFLETCLMRL